MNSGEIDLFLKRQSRFTDQGVSRDQAEALADVLVKRDCESDDRRLCLECAHLQGRGLWRCGNWQAAVVARDGLARHLVLMLQRCSGFKNTPNLYKDRMMKNIEAVMIHEAALIARHESAPDARIGNYEPVRLNVMKHGILSRLAVLAHEDHAEFADLLAALIEEQRPAGMTERHLIEELATIIWRKRRVLLAEGAKINEGLKGAVNSAASVIKSAAPFQRGIGGENADLREFMEGTPEEIAERQRDAALDLAATQKVAAILRKGGPNDYTKARRALIQDSRDWWDELVEEESYPATAEGLASFIRDSLEPICYGMVKEAEFTPAIKAQTLGEGLRAHLLEKLNRYETYLDRKFERTLAMLLKLKDLRGA